MIPASLPPGVAAALWGLLALWAGLLFGGFVFGKPTADDQRRMPAWTRMASSFVLVTAAWTWYVILQPGALGPYALLMAAGMTAGFVGDLFMARLLPVKQYVLAGIAAFGLGHVAYISALLRLARPEPLFFAGWGAWLLLGLGGWYFVVFKPAARATALHRAALPYSLLLASTAGVATGATLAGAPLALAALGAALFLISDLILAARLFNGLRFRLSDDLVWLTYGPAEMLLVYAAGRIL